MMKAINLQDQEREENNQQATVADGNRKTRNGFEAEKPKVASLTPGWRKFALTAHIVFSVGWLGAVGGFLGLAVIGLTNDNPQIVRASYLLMEPLGWYVIVPFCLFSIITGLVQSLGTQWDIFRHYWVLAKFLLTAVSTPILFVFMKTLGQLGDLAADDAVPFENLRNASPVIHSALALLVLLVNTTLSVYKPRGMTRYGRQRQKN